MQGILAAQPAPQAASLSRLTDDHWLGEMTSLLPVKSMRPFSAASRRRDRPVYQHAMIYRIPASSVNAEPSQIQLAQFGEPIPPGTKVPPSAAHRERASTFPRTDMPVQIFWSPGGPANERVAVITSGVNLMIDELENLIGSVDAADRMVVARQRTSS